MTPTTLAEALAETLIVLGEPNSARLHSCYPGHHDREYAAEIAAVILALPPDQRAAIAAELYPEANQGKKFADCRADLRCYRNDGHGGEHAYPDGPT